MMESNINATGNNTLAANSQEYKIDSSISNTNKFIYLTASLFLAILFDRFFLTGMPGISVTIFTVFFISLFYIFNREDINFKNPAGLFVLFSLIISAFNYTLYSNPFMEVLNFLAMPIFCTIAFILLRYKSTLWDRLIFIGEMIFRIIVSPILNIPKPFTFIKKIISRQNQRSSSIRKNIITGAVISLFLLLIIIPLLSSADMVFNYFLADITNHFKINNFSEIIFHCVFIFFVFIYIFGYMLSFKYNTKIISKQEDTGIKKWINPITAVTSLIPLAVVYLLFSIIQFSYLYGESGILLPDGFTYAEYARRGFFELVAVTVINFAIIIFITHFTDIKTALQKRFLNILLTLMTLFTFNMLFSANFKLSLYEGEYGFTYLRFFVHGFIFLIFLMLIFLLAGIWSNKINIIKCCLVISITLFCILNLISPDRIIAQKNISRYQTTGKIDVKYLAQLSYDSIPVLVDFSSTNSPAAVETRNMLLQKKENMHHSKWYEFNIGKYRAERIIANLK